MISRNPRIKAFIKHHSQIFWYIPEAKKETISDEFLLEHVINHCDIPAIMELFTIMGTEKAELIFRSLKGRRKNNIYPEYYNLFDLYFKRHVQAGTQ